MKNTLCNENPGYIISPYIIHIHWGSLSAPRGTWHLFGTCISQQLLLEGKGDLLLSFTLFLIIKCTGTFFFLIRVISLCPMGNFLSGQSRWEIKRIEKKIAEDTVGVCVGWAVGSWCVMLEILWVWGEALASNSYSLRLMPHNPGTKNSMVGFFFYLLLYCRSWFENEFFLLTWEQLLFIYICVRNANEQQRPNLIRILLPVNQSFKGKGANTLSCTKLLRNHRVA